jgi:hypothetical protein
VATATATPKAPYTSSAKLSPATVTRAANVSIASSVTLGAAAAVIIDVEVYDAAGTRVYQRAWTNQAFTAGQTRTFTTSWAVPATASPGAYTVKIGVFKTGWAALLNWNNSAAILTVV